MSVKINTKVKKFKVSATNSLEINSDDLKGKNVVIYFYPKDNTPGCTQEGEDFRDLYKEFKKLKTEIYGVSRAVSYTHLTLPTMELV